MGQGAQGEAPPVPKVPMTHTLTLGAVAPARHSYPGGALQIPGHDALVTPVVLENRPTAQGPEQEDATRPGVSP